MRWFLFLVTNFALLQSFYCQWVDLQAELEGDLTGVYFWNSTQGVVCGEEGIYYTTNGGVGAASWSRFEISGAPADSVMYNNISFAAVTGRASEPGVAYACGTDLVEGKAVVMRVDILLGDHEFLFIGPENTSFNDITFMMDAQLGVVGNNGYMVSATNIFYFSDVLLTTTADLFSISTQDFNVFIGGDGVVLRGPIHQPTIYYYPGRTFKAVTAGGSYNKAVGEMIYRFPGTPSPITELPHADPLPLNGVAMHNNIQATWVATDHGIYRGLPGGLMNFLEYQPSSEGRVLNDVFFTSTDLFRGYAVGEGGVVLYTENGGGEMLPFTAIYATGGCTGAPLQVSAIFGTGIAGGAWGGPCQWYLDGQPIAGSCNWEPFTLTFEDDLVHELMVVNWNIYASDTAYAQLQAVIPPSVALAVAVSDTILCKEESITITISGSEPDVLYTCRNITLGTTIASGTGNGGDLQLITSPIDLSAALVIRAENIYENCPRVFPDTIQILVEETRGDFHADLINAQLGESFDLHTWSQDAAFFEWSFGPGASIPTSTVVEPTDISYSMEGQTYIQLISTSIHGCKDTLLKEGPFIYGTVPADSCWVLHLQGQDAQWGGQYIPAIYDAERTTDGYVVSGRSSLNVQVPTRAGVGKYLASNGGTFVAKYTYEGVLKWLVECPGPNLRVTALDVLTNGDIVIGGHGYTAYPIIDNRGDSLVFGVPGECGGSMIVTRLTTMGKYVWHGTGGSMTIQSISSDEAENIVILGRIGGSGARYCFEGIPHYFGANAPSSPYKWLYLMKLNGAGEVVWQTYFENSHTNFADCRTLDVAANGYIALGGDYENSLLLRSAGGGSTYMIQPPGNIITNGLYICQFDPSGQIDWVVNSERSLSYTAYIQDLSYGPGNKLYATGGNGLTNPSVQLQLFHSDGSESALIGSGRYFVSCFSSQGHLEWQNGTMFSNHSYGLGINVNEANVAVVMKVASQQVVGLTFTSVGSPQHWVEAAQGDLLIPVYGLDGMLHHVHHPSPYDPNGVNAMISRRPLLRDPQGNLILMGEFSKTGISDVAHYYGYDILLPTSTTFDIDGVMVRIGEGCADIPTMDTEVAMDGAGMTAYPNPVEDELYVRMPGHGRWAITLMDPLGRILNQLQLEGDHVRISRNELAAASGPVVLVAEQNGVRHTCTVVVTR